MSALTLHPPDLAILQRLLALPIPAEELKARTVARLEALDLVEIVPLPSPYKRGGLVDQVRILPAGRTLLAVTA